eukprot:7167369-Prymnesium_polylepis.5
MQRVADEIVDVALKVNPFIPFWIHRLLDHPTLLPLVPAGRDPHVRIRLATLKEAGVCDNEIARASQVYTQETIIRFDVTDRCDQVRLGFTLLGAPLGGLVAEGEVEAALSREWLGERDKLPCADVAQKRKRLRSELTPATPHAALS